ncbi:hypothetical protein [Telmatospirillum sp.]|uniref:hypothetical protein n=1 Tax=Telmatospirillum sp. TaxID=2079197 RepID=UPI0028519973|nr:hypothetical protein [Telmatospirillum sp.]MDR3435510.1 hypothetical protein [Telmatospirillum sp.]
MIQAEQPVLILGATSDIGRAVARVFAAHGHPLLLAARRMDRLSDDADDLRIRFGVDVSLHAFDALDIAAHSSFVDALPVLPEIAVCLVGVLGEQTACQSDPQAGRGRHPRQFRGAGPSSR